VSDHRTERNFIIALFALAIALRFGYALYMQHNYFFYSNPGEDVLYYKNWAKAIALREGNTHEAFSGMPLFPYYLAVLFRLTLGHWAVVAFFNLILGAFNCVLVYYLAKKLFSTRTAIIAGLLTATNFILIYYDWLMMPITLLITLTVVILLGITGKGPVTKRQWFILGILLGLGTLGDGKFLIFTALFILYNIWKRFDFSIAKIIPTMVPLLIGLTLVLGGVTMRNKIVGGEWIFISSQSGLSLYVGNNAQATGAFENPEFIRPSHEGQDADQKIFAEQSLRKKLTLSEVSDFYRQSALSFIKNQPGDYVRLLGRKTQLFIGDHEQSQAIDLILQRDYKRMLDWNSYSVIFPLALLGIFVALQQRKEVTFTALMVASQLIFSLIYFVTTRHRASILPLILIFEAFALTWLVDKLFARQYKPLIAGLALVFVYLFCFPPKFIDAKTFDFLTFSKSGSVYDGRKDYGQAAQSYANALTLQPNDANSLYNLATAYVNLKEYKKAEGLYLKALAITDFNVDVLFNLGFVYEQTAETEKALQSYENVLGHMPTSLDAHFRIAGVYQRQGQCEKAQSHYDEIIRQNPILKAEIGKISGSCRHD